MGANRKSYMVYRTAPFSMTLERFQTQISRSGHSLTLNISEMAKDTPIVTMEGNRKSYPSFHMVPFSITLSDL